MAEFLYRLGRASARRAWLVVVAWIVVIAAAGGAFAVWGGTLSTAITIPGTETARVTERLQSALPQASGGTGTLVFSSSDGSALTTTQQAAITAVIAEAAQVDGVEAVVDPFATVDQRAAGELQITEGLAQIEAARAQLQQGQDQLDAAVAQATSSGAFDQARATLDAQQATIDASAAALDAQRSQLELGTALLEMSAEMRSVSLDGSTAVGTIVFTAPELEVSTETKAAVLAVLDGGPIDGVQTDVSAEIASATPGLGVGEVLGVAIAAAVLLVMLGTFVAAGLPLISALLGVAVGALGTLALSGSIEMVSATPLLGVMLGLAVGIDYTLFILNRHRRQLREGLELHESIGLANGTSGNAVVFAGVTVMIALLALNVTGIPFLGLMGVVAAFSVAVAVLIAITLTPAMLGIAGTRVLPRKHRTITPHDVTSPAPKLALPMSTRRAVLSILGGVAALGLIALPALSMRLGLPDGSSEPQESTQYAAYTTIAQEFGAGQNGPLVVAVDLPANMSDDDITALQVLVGEAIMQQDDVVAVAPIATAADKSLTAFQVIPAGGPTSVSTEQLVHDLRNLTFAEDPDLTLSVAGAASGNIDISEKLSSALPIYLILVVGLSLMILVLVFRSILVPLVATGGFVLSLFAAFGGVTAIYQWGWLGSVFGVHDPGPVLNFLPTLLVGILFGLAMDYQLFLVSGMREAYVHGAPARNAVMEGLHAGRTVVTAAAIIMISVFGGFVFSETTVIRPLGFGLAFGVLLDAFVVRMLIVPAIMHLAGDKAWWLPRWLERLLPNVDIEGAALERRHHQHIATVDEVAPAPTPEPALAPATTE
ncbi:MMPL family transporter [Cellulomonas sp. KRMCY2]|uniref:MMPL family transporter n=1 Tax=Cellulomonas sp. KRMCY2 TaxID=1304865 RepID=UPI00045E8565|nr:MMPL family transporter [Cellulomonas sp. KRMCY2]